METRTNMKKKNVFALVGLSLALGMGAAAGLSVGRTAIEPAKADNAALAKDKTVFVMLYDAVKDTFFDDDIGMYWYDEAKDVGGTVEVNRIGDAALGYATIPSGASKVEVMRLKSGHGVLPCDGMVSGETDNQWQALYLQDDDKLNGYCITGWNSDNLWWQTGNDKVVLPEGMPVFVHFNEDWWWNDSASIYMYHNLANAFYGYGSGSNFESMTRIGETNYAYFVPASTIVADQVIVTRKVGENYWTNQTTDVTTGNHYYNTCLLDVLTTKNQYNSYDWSSMSMADTANAYGELFLNSVTCGGETGANAGTITSPSSVWTTLKNIYDGLSVNVQGLVWKAAGSLSGTALEQAMYRYDYIAFYKKALDAATYADYTDFIGRDNEGSGKTSFALTASPLPVRQSNDSAALIAASVSAVALVGIGGFFLLRRKHQN